MDHAELVDALRREGEAFAAVVPADIDVPTCPGWTLIDLYRHLGSVHRYQLAQVDTSDPDTIQPRPDLDTPSEPGGLVDWLLAGIDALADRLTAVGPDHLTSSWHGPAPAHFWARRAAHETAVHRWDAEAAVTSPTPFAAVHAADIVDELFEVIAAGRLQRHPWAGPAATIHLHATDDGAAVGEWMVQLDGPSITVEHAHGKGDVAVRGATSDLALVMFGRIPLARLEVFGDATVIDRWHDGVQV